MIAWVPLTVTLPAGVWNTAKLLLQSRLPVPLTVVQLVVVASQVPLPPWITPSLTVLLPSQNSTLPLAPPTSRLTCAPIAVCTCRSLGWTLPGTEPITRPLSVRAPV